MEMTQVGGQSDSRNVPDSRRLIFPYILESYTSLNPEDDVPRDHQRSKPHYLSSFAWRWLSYCISILHRYLPQGKTL